MESGEVDWEAEASMAAEMAAKFRAKMREVDDGSVDIVEAINQGLGKT